MFKILCLLVLLGGAVNGRSRGRHVKSHDDGKIVGGQEVTINEYPYQVYLLIQIGINYYACGGSIISANYVLTAAHCLVGATRVHVRAGSTDSDSGGKMYSSSIYTIHPKYNRQTSDYDIGVIKLLRKMTLDGTTTKAVQLPSSDTMVVPGDNVIVTGWGATSEGGDTTNILNAVTVPITTPEFCNQSYSGGITDRMICAGTEEGGKDSCQGDSGGPAVNETSLVQYGVVSFGIGCARPNVPGVYTSVPALRDWIKKTTGV
ncbi:trypsin 5G1-like [Amyelois transitella]|uniref:trypsin 5G1-like n=1 Tax=Amyelois transitella TaxID=680683 RepID=UPI00299012AB|nr:trypsin 5G1-like [Amyelois transitella]